MDDKKSYRITEASVPLKRNYNGGRFISSSPLSAARKAVRSIYDKTTASTPKSVSFTIVETTRGSKHKEFSYVGKKVRLPKPMQVERDGVTYSVEYRYDVRAAK